MAPIRSLFFNIIFQYQKKTFQYRDYFNFEDNNEIIKYIKQSYPGFRELFTQTSISSFEALRLESVSINPSLSNNSISYPLLDAFAISVKIANQNSLIHISNQEIKFLYDFTEYYKLFLTEIKNDLHLLLILYSNQSSFTESNSNTNKLLLFLKKLKKKYQLSVSVGKQSLFTVLSTFIRTFYHNFINHTFTINNNDGQIDILNKYIDLLKTIKLGRLAYKKQKCFCLVHENKYFYTISGYDFDYDKDQMDELNQIGKNLHDIFSQYEFQYCPISDYTLSYGFCSNRNRLIKYNYPIPFFLAYDKQFPSIDSQYSCCERKIFSFLNNYNIELEIYCKYAPCTKCIPAVKEEKKFRQGKLTFDYFYLNFPTFSALYKRKIKHKLKIYDTKKMLIYMG